MTPSIAHSGVKMDKLNPLEPLLDAEAVGQILGLRSKTVLKLARSGMLPGLRFTRHWRFRKSDIIEWLESEAARSGPSGSL